MSTIRILCWFICVVNSWQMLVVKYAYTCVFNNLLNIQSYKTARNLASKLATLRDIATLSLFS